MKPTMLSLMVFAAPKDPRTARGPKAEAPQSRNRSYEIWRAADTRSTCLGSGRSALIKPALRGRSPYAEEAQ
jgi:hypothetical protein